MKPCANLTFLFKELPFLERFEAAADAGFQAVEVLFPYDDPAPDILRRLAASGLPLALINAPPPNYTGGARGFAAVPASTDRFRRDIARVLRYAQRLKPEFIHVMAGNARGPEAKAAFIDNLRWATAEAPEQHFTIEPLCGVDLPDYFLNDYDLAAEVIGAVGAPNLSLQYDCFHAQMLTGDAEAVYRTHHPLVRHIQVSDSPDRTAPGTGQIDFPALFKAIAATGYDGWISGEYNTGGDTRATLDWLKRL